TDAHRVTTDSKVLLAIIEESQRAHGTYGNPTSAHESLGVLIEELDELRDAIHMNNSASTYEEAVQVASVAYRLALAIESVVREHGFDAFTAFDQVWLTDPRVGIIPSFGTGRLCEIGIAASPEGDVNCAVAQLIMQELAGQSTTVENYVIDFDNNAVMFSHDGHGNPALGTPGETKVKHSIYYQGVHGFGAGFEFAYEPGPVTNLALVTMGEGIWRFVISEGEFLPFPPRPISAPQTLFRHHELEIADWCDAWCQAGAPHHMAAAKGSWTSQLLVLARLLGIEAVVV
ncbi:MAG: hypothetical protein MUQ32_11685, partial [Chloroflexi bacterium]|nr:hypothetical protein [Chloroflexota bacterium]